MKNLKKHLFSFLSLRPLNNGSMNPEEKLKFILRKYGKMTRWQAGSYLCLDSEETDKLFNKLLRENVIAKDTIPDELLKLSNVDEDDKFLYALN